MRLEVESLNRLFFHQGFVHLRSLVADGHARKTPLLQALQSNLRQHTQRVLDKLDRKAIGIGSRAGFYEVVQRSPGRFDVPILVTEPSQCLEKRVRDVILRGSGEFSGPDDEISITDASDCPWPWLPSIHHFLGEDAELCFAGVVVSIPGAPAQEWHIDSPHEGGEHRPAHCCNVLIALDDAPLEAGPTEFASGSHVLTNHLRWPGMLDEWSTDDMLYQQTAKEVTPEMLCEFFCETQLNRRVANPLEAGDVLIFDDRILHRGLANKTGRWRWIGYFGYRRPRDMENVADTHFEARRSLWDEYEKKSMG